MLNQLTTLIREKYLNLEKKKNEKTNIEIHLYQAQKEITELEKNIAELENDREFYTLVNLYNVYKNYDFPQNILDIVINRKVSVVGRLCCSRTISNLSFGEWLDLWKNGWIYDGNPVIFAFSCLSGGYIEYWDLVERTLKRAKPKEKFIYTPEKNSSAERSSLGVKDIVLFVQTKICSKP